MLGWHHRLNGHEFEQALGVGDEQGSLACCSPWGHKEMDATERRDCLAVLVCDSSCCFLSTLLDPVRCPYWVLRAV